MFLQRAAFTLCRLGIHDDELIEEKFDFGGTTMMKFRCRRCGRLMHRTQS